jgi:hypothetical protein
VLLYFLVGLEFLALLLDLVDLVLLLGLVLL